MDVCLPLEDVTLALLLSVNDVKHADRLVGRARREPLAVVVELGVVLREEQRSSTRSSGPSCNDAGPLNASS